MSHESFEDLESKSLAVLEREPATGFDDSDSTTTVTVRTRPQPSRLPKATAKPATQSEQPAGVARRFRDRFPNGVSWGLMAWMGGMPARPVAPFSVFPSH